MADGNIPITAGSGTPIRALTNTGVQSGAYQQVFTLADQAGNLLGTVGAPLPVQQADQSAVISIAANATSSASLTALTGASSCLIQLTGTFVATVQLQVTADGGTWVNITGSNTIINAATGAYITGGNMTAVGAYQLDIGGFLGVRVITTSYTSGTVGGVVRVTNASAAVSVEGIPTVLLGAAANTVGSVNLNSGTNALGSVRIGAVTPSTSFYTSTTTNAATVAKTSAADVQVLLLTNTGTAAQFFKLFNATTVTLGTTAAVADIAIPASGTPVTVNLGANGLRLPTGFAYAVTGAVGATNNTAGAGGVLVAATYI